MSKGVLLALVFLRCWDMQAVSQVKASDDLKRFFTSAGVEGTILLYELHTGQSSGYHADRWDSAYIPASTFKIFNALAALETGAIQDEQTIIPWDQVERPVAEWNRDQTLASAFRVSAVWFYQELARRIGTERMQTFLDSAGYGNRLMGGPIDIFWLDGGLRITPRQQVEFLVRLHMNALPFSRRSMKIVKEIMVQEKTESHTLRAKTGWSDEVGWYVGYVERSEGVFFFATEIDIRREEDVSARVEVTKAILRRLGLL
jgi:beta-lactamase class D